MRFPGISKLRGNNAVIALVIFVIFGWCPAVAESIPKLIEALTYDEAGNNVLGVRANAAEALGNMDRSVAQPAIPALIKALRDEDGYVRIMAAEALAKLGADDPLMVPILIGNPNASNALQVMGVKAVPGLKSLLRNEDPGIRSQATWALEQIDDPIAREVVAKIREDRQQVAAEESRLWGKYSRGLVYQGQLKIPSIKTLLQMAGYAQGSPVRIFSSDLFLKNQIGYPTIDTRYFIFTTKGIKSRIKKVIVILLNRGEDETEAANLLAFAPTLLYIKGHETKSERMDDGSTSISSGPKEFASYISKEVESAETKEPYIVYPHKASYWVFHYGEKYKANDGMFRGNLGYDDVCALIIKGANDLRGEGKAQLRVGEGGKFHLADLKAIYP